LLEKKKDYLLRAKDFHKKEATIKHLRRKAEERNPDEFYFSMENAQTKNGVHTVPTAQANKYSQEQLRLMKTQDASYLAVKAQSERKKVERLRGSLHLIGAPAPKRRHVVFVDEEEQVASFDAAHHFDTPKELLERSYNRPTHAQLADPAAVMGGGNAETLRKAERRRAASYKEFLQRRERQEALQGAAQKMEYDKAIMGGGRRRKLRPEETGGATRVFKWKAERKR
jgi:U3 small nucleolar RNA-associated protein 11